MIADTVFSVDPDSAIQADFSDNPSNYVKSIDNLIIRNVFFFICKFLLMFYLRLRKEYRTCNEKLGQTGAGLRYEDIQEGSDLKNLVSRYKFFYHISFNPNTWT
jgi:hypothetical protein